MRSRLVTLVLVAGLLSGCAQPLQSGTATTPKVVPESPTSTPNLRPTVPGTPKPQPVPEPTPTPTPKPKPVPEPLPEPVRLNAAGAPDLDPLRAHLQAYIERQEGTYGFYLIDLISGKGVGMNENQAFRTASTFKLPMSLYVINEVAAGRASLDDQLTYQESDFEEGTGTLQNSIEPGDQFPLGQLIDLALSESDNIATNMICRRFGFQPIYAYMLKLGGTVTHYEDEGIGTTPKDMATYMHQLYRPTGMAVATPELRQRLLDSLLHTSFHDRTEAGVPEGVKVAHKIGTLTGVVNDVALVYAPKRPFILAVFSMDDSEDTASQVIAEIARQAYQFLNS